jgi:hypothetical protein
MGRGLGRRQIKPRMAEHAEVRRFRATMLATIATCGGMERSAQRACRSLAFSWQNCKCPCRKPETIAHLRPRDDDQRTSRGHLVEIGHHLDLVMPIL